VVVTLTTVRTAGGRTTTAPPITVPVRGPSVGSLGEATPVTDKGDLATAAVAMMGRW